MNVIPDAAFLNALADILKEERGITDAALQASDATIREAIAAQVREIERTPGPKGDRGLRGFKGGKGADGRPADPLEVARSLADDEGFVEKVRGPKGDPGEPGEPGPEGRAGRDGADAEPDAVARVLAVDRNFADLARGPQGPEGPEGPAGRDGADGRDADEAAVARALLETPAFLEATRGQDGEDGIGLDVAPWEDRVYRQGELAGYGHGRVAQALCDTRSRPGRSDDWRRIGTGGFEWKGVKKDGVAYEEGDIVVDRGSSFLYSGGRFVMQTQRGRTGKPGAKGEPGAKGDPGEPAAKVIECAFTDDGMFRQVFDDGEVIETPWLELADGAVPIRSFRGFWKPSLDYARGDVVREGGATWIAEKTPSRGKFPGREWVTFAAGGGGTVASSTPSPGGGVTLPPDAIGYLSNDGSGGLSWTAAPGGSALPADAVGYLSNDGSGGLSWAAAPGGASLPPDAAGALVNDGAGGLTWVPMPSGGAGLPADAAGHLANDGTGTLTWEPAPTPFSGAWGDLSGKPATFPPDMGDAALTAALGAKQDALPAAAAGYLANDGAGVLSWQTPPSGGTGVSLPPDAAGVLQNDGAGALTWVTLPQAGLQPPTGGPTDVWAWSTGTNDWTNLQAELGNIDAAILRITDLETWQNGFPADAAGALVNDGAGALTWVALPQPGASLPADAAGHLTNDGAGNLTWEAPPAGGSSGPFTIEYGSSAPVFRVKGLPWYDSANARLNLWDDGSQSWYTIASKLPSDASGVLTNDGFGGLTWSTVQGGGGGVTLPADAAGVLRNDGAGALSWEPDPAPPAVTPGTDAIPATGWTYAVPIGALYGWIEALPLPAGFLKCDGAAVPAANTRLIALIGANVPVVEAPQPGVIWIMRAA